jgi:hypothetical protein
MADTKITNLAAQTAASGDEVPANRAGADCKLLVQDIAATLTAASDTAAGKIEIAIQSEMETAKFWVYWTGNSTTILRDYNVDSVANTAAGDADVTITTDFSDANWAGFVCTNDSTATGWDADSIQSSGFNARAAGTFGVLCGLMIDGGTAVGNTTHPQQWNAMGFGDHA